MMLRIGTTKGLNIDLLQTWEYTAPPEPEPEPAPEPVPTPEPEPDGEHATPDVPEEPSTEETAASTVPTTLTAPVPPSLSTLTLYFAGRELVLEGEDADKVHGYLTGSKVGAVV